MPNKARRKPLSETPIITPDTDHKPVIEYTVTPDLPPCASINSPAKIDCRPLVERVNEGKQEEPGQDAQKRAENLVSKPSLPNIPIKQRLFLKALTDPSSPTYGNQTLSYQSVYKNESVNSAAVNSSRILTKTKTKTWIEEILDRQGAGIEDRVSRVNSIASGNVDPITIRRQTMDKQGNIHTLKEIRPPSFSERIKADALLSKIAGDTTESKHTNKLAEIEFKELCKRTLKQTSNKVRKVKDIEQEPITGDGTEATGGRD